MTIIKDDKNSNVSRDAMILTFSRVMNMLIALLSAMLLSRFRSLDEYGTYSQIQVVVGLATSVFTLGLPNSLNYFLAKNNTEENDVFLSMYYALITILSVVAGLSLVAASGFLCDYYNNDRISDFSYVLGILPWTQVLTTSISNMLVATKKTIRLVIYSLFRSIALLLLIVFVRIIGEDFYFYMVFYVIAESVFSLWVYYEAFRLIKKIHLVPNLQLLKEILVFSIPMGIASAIGTLDIYLDNLMVGYFFDTKTLAVFTNAAKELPFNMIANAFTAVLIPYMVRQLQNKNTEKAVRMWSFSTEFNTYILAFCAAACFVFAPQILTILYSSKYVDGTNVFRVYSLVLLLKTTYFGMVLNALGRSKYVLYSSMVSLVTNIVLNYIFINLFGTVGAAAATFISILVTALAQLFMSSKLLKVKFSKIYPWASVGKIILINVTWSVCAFIILRVLNIGIDLYGIIISVIIGAVCSLIYILVIKKRLIYVYKQLGNSEEVNK